MPQITVCVPPRGIGQRWRRSDRAQHAFADPQRVIAKDITHSQIEERFYGFGEVDGGVLTQRFTYRASVIRIIGAGYWRKGKAIYERENKIHG